MNVKAIIREVYVELSSRGPAAIEPGLPDRFLPFRRLYLDPFAGGYNARKAAVGLGRRRPDDPEADPGAYTPPAEVAAKKSP